ncbi:hypothetical protein BDV12DRAFT_202712 [Aspergillus spectabilis]
MPQQVQQTSAMITSYLQSLPGIGLPSEIGETPAGACRNQEHVLSKEMTAEIIAACKEKKVSVTSAVHAAYVCMLLNHADPASNRSRYTTANEYNMQPYLPVPHSTTSSAVAVYYVPMPFTIDLPASYMDIAQTLHRHYQTSLKGSPETVALTPHYCHMIAALAKTEAFKSAPIATDDFVSRLGVIEQHLHRQASVQTHTFLQCHIRSPSARKRRASLSRRHYRCLLPILTQRRTANPNPTPSDRIFAVGDVATHPGPLIARAGFMQAEIILRNILSLISGQPSAKLYKPNQIGSSREQ